MQKRAHGSTVVSHLFFSVLPGKHAQVGGDPRHSSVSPQTLSDVCGILAPNKPCLSKTSSDVTKASHLVCMGVRVMRKKKVVRFVGNHKCIRKRTTEESKAGMWKGGFTKLAPRPTVHLHDMYCLVVAEDPRAAANPHHAWLTILSTSPKAKN
jgi:hypothetical protein